MNRPATGLHAITVLLCLTLAACGKPEETGSSAEDTKPSIKEQAADLQKKAGQKAAEAVEKTEQAAAQAAEKAREVATEAAQKVGSATETAGHKVQEAGAAITDKALSQPERIPEAKSPDGAPADAR